MAGVFNVPKVAGLAKPHMNKERNMLQRKAIASFCP